MAKVLVVDDTAALRSAMCRALEDSDLGVQVIEAQDGAEALTLALEDGIDVVVTDINMPRLDGIGLLRGIRGQRDAYALPVILVTSQGEERQRQASFEVGASDYLYRPFGDDELRDRVRVQLRVRRLHGELVSAAAERTHLENHDDLTGLANRRSFVARCAAACDEARASGGELAVALVAIDRQRSLARDLGVGNLEVVLVEVAAQLQRHFAGATVIAHLADGKFGVLSVGAGGERVREQALALCEFLRSHVMGRVVPGQIHMSVAIRALAGAQSPSADVLLNEVESLLDRAMAAGGNCVEMST